MFDTDILVWSLRRNVNASRVIDSDRSRTISLCSVLELHYGVLNKTELRQMEAFLAGFEVLPLAPAIGDRSIQPVRNIDLKIRLGSLDALIAATALEYRLPLCTANLKHFAHVQGLELVPFHPAD